MAETKRIGIKEAAKKLINILNDRQNDDIDNDDEMYARIVAHLNSKDVKVVLYNGDDPKSWYSPLSAWKKQKVDEAFKRWKTGSKENTI